MGVRILSGLPFRVRLTAGREPLELAIRVRIPDSEPIPESSNRQDAALKAEIT